MVRLASLTGCEHARDTDLLIDDTQEEPWDRRIGGTDSGPAGGAFREGQSPSIAP